MHDLSIHHPSVPISRIYEMSATSNKTPSEVDSIEIVLLSVHVTVQAVSACVYAVKVGHLRYLTDVV